MAGLALIDRSFHLSIATKGLAPSTWGEGPVGIRGFFWIASRHGVNGRVSSANRNQDLIHQQMTVRASFGQKIWDDTKIVALKDDDLIKVSVNFKQIQPIADIKIDIKFIGTENLGK